MRNSEKGNATLAIMIFIGMALLGIMTVAAMNSMREYRSLDKSFEKSNEKWSARSAVNSLAAAISRDIPPALDADVRTARTNCQLAVTVPIFDEPDVALSIPAISKNNNSISCNQGTPTSIFGSFSTWINSTLPTVKQNAISQFGLDSERVDVIEFKQIYVRSIGSAPNERAYGTRFIVEGKAGNYRTRTNGEIVLGTRIPNCGTSTSVEFIPSTITEGDTVAMNIAYTYAGNLQIFDNSNNLIHSQNVTEQSGQQTFSYNLTPITTSTYRVRVNGSGGCSAQSSPIVVTVVPRPPTCPSISSFNSSAQTITTGNSVTLTWNVQDASSVTLDGVNVNSSGNQTFTLNANRTFTLVAQPTSGACGQVTQQLTVAVQPPPCSFSAPSITNFAANTNSIALGGNFQLSWDVAGIQSGGTITITGANGFSQNVGANGSLTISPPNVVGNYTYTITAENVCPDGTRLTSTQNVTIQVRACPPPSIDVFTVSPSSVSQGGNALIQFSWQISGTADAVSISNGVGSGLPSSGTLDFTQPQNSTTYTITAVGCGQTRTAQVTVTVNACPMPQINSFTATPSIVIQGGNQTVRLQWSASSVCSATASIDNGVGSVPVSGYVDIIQPQATTTYHLSVTSPGGTVTVPVTITVNPPASVACSGSIYLTFPAPETDGHGSTSVVIERNKPVGQTTINLDWNPLPFNLNNSGDRGLTAITYNFYDNINGYNVNSSSLFPTPPYTITENEMKVGNKIITLPFVVSNNVTMTVWMDWQTFLSANPGEIFAASASDSAPCNPL